MSTYRKPISTSPTFKVLVAHLERSSDPSKGESGNPVAIRQSFESQVVTTPEGVGLRGIVNTRAPTAIILVNSTEYGNTNVVAGPPFYDRDYIKAWAGGVEDSYSISPLEAGYDFGVGQGNGQGNTSDVASSLAGVLTRLDLGIKAIVDPNNNSQVIVSSLTPTDPLVLNIRSVAFNLFNGNPPFIILSEDGNKTLYNPAVNGKSNARVIVRASGLDPIISS